jgi:AmpD protein
MMQIDARGWLDVAEHLVSPNCDERPGSAIDLLVIHNISLPPGEFGGEAVHQFFTNQLDVDAHAYFTVIADLKVSSHFFIRRDGVVAQFVPCQLRAWHAGASCWQGRSRCNDFSIGIELEGTDYTPFSDAQYASLVELTQLLCAKYSIRGIAGHSDIAPLRKTDPGPHFDWLRYLVRLSSK